MTNDWVWMIVGPKSDLKLTGDLALPRERYEAYLLAALRTPLYGRVDANVSRRSRRWPRRHSSRK